MIFCCVCNVLVCFVAGEVFVDVDVIFYSPDQLAIYIALTHFLAINFHVAQVIFVFNCFFVVVILLIIVQHKYIFCKYLLGVLPESSLSALYIAVQIPVFNCVCIFWFSLASRKNFQHFRHCVNLLVVSHCLK